MRAAPAHTLDLKPSGKVVAGEEVVQVTRSWSWVS
jgi:hypothetical protein